MVTSNDPIFYFTEKQLTYAEELKQNEMFVLSDMCFIESDCMFTVVFHYSLSKSYMVMSSIRVQYIHNKSEFLEKSHELQILVIFASMFVVHRSCS